MAGDSLIFDLAKALLTAVEAYYDEVEVNLPGRRYVHFGEVAIDGGLIYACEQLVVTDAPGAFQGFPGAPDGGALTCEQPTTVSFEVWLSRCVPVMKENGDPPNPSDLESSAKTMMIDQRTIQRGIYIAQKHRTLFPPPFPECRLIRIGESLAQGPEGGYSSVVQPVEVSLL